MAEHVARCQCGQVRVQAKTDPAAVIVCNCKACQRRTGAPFGTGGYWPLEALTFHGATKTYERTADSGLGLVNHFCPSCGTTVWWTLELRPGMAGVAFGCFDAPLPEPARVVWTEEQHGWVTFPEHWPRFEKGTPRA